MSFPASLTLIADSAHGLQGALERGMEFISAHDYGWYARLVADHFDPNSPEFCWCQVDYEAATWLADDIERGNHAILWRDGDLWFDPNFELDTEPF